MWVCGCTHSLNLVLLLVHSGYSHSAVLPSVVGVASHHHTTLDRHTHNTQSQTNTKVGLSYWGRELVKFQGENSHSLDASFEL